MNNIRVMLCEVGKKSYVKEIPNGQMCMNWSEDILKPLLNKLAIVVCNEEGILLNLPLITIWEFISLKFLCRKN